MAYQIPRNVKGEGRILFIFSTKGLIFTCGGAAIGLVFWWILKQVGLGTARNSYINTTRSNWIWHWNIKST